MPKSNDSILRRHPLTFVFLTVIICLMPILTQRDFTPMNELRYLSIADEMIENDHIFILTNHGEPYADKPPLYIWLIILLKKLAGGHSIFLLSMLGLIPAFIAVAVLDKWIFVDDKKNALDRAAMALMLCSSGLFLTLSFYFRMDMMMTMFIVLALYSFHLMYSGRGNFKLQSWLLPLWIFLAIFTKGPVGLLMPVLVILVFLLMEKEAKELGKYLGIKTLGVIASLCALWFLGVIAEHGGKEYLYDLTVHQTFGRAVNSFHHNEPIYYYLKNIWLTIFPYSILIFPVLSAGLPSPRKMKTGEKSDDEKIFLISFWGTFLMLCIISSKHILYLMPLVPFAIYGFYLTVKRMGWRKWMNILLSITAGLICLTAVALIIAFRADSIPVLHKILSGYPFLQSNFTTVALVMMLIGGAMSLIILFWKRQWQKSIIWLALGWLLAVYSASFQMNQINDIIGYGNFCKAIPENTNVAAINVRRPENIDVYIHREIAKDYAKDTTAFKNDLANGTLQKPVTLIVSDKMLRKGFLGWCERNGSLIDCHGPYALVFFGNEQNEAPPASENPS